MSCFYTQQQMRDKTKTVTRRLGWSFLKAGDVVCACVQCQGLAKGQKVERLGMIRILSNREERLFEISGDEMAKEGFPDLSPQEFVEMFCRHMKVKPGQVVNRIEFEHFK
jgi:hypothetical protein